VGCCMLYLRDLGPILVQLYTPAKICMLAVDLSSTWPYSYITVRCTYGLALDRTAVLRSVPGGVLLLGGAHRRRTHLPAALRADLFSLR
jgi:hypothetical protein